MVKAVIFWIISYFLGNISPSTILARLAGKDIKKEGSGNAGTTNALRVLGTRAAIITLIIDMAKGFIAMGLGLLILPENLAAWCGIAVLLGHVWPILLKFQGGKGVATAFGVLLAVNWKIALICLGIVIVMVMITRMVSLGSIAAAVIFPTLAWFMARWFFYPGMVMVGVLLFKHSENMERIIHGEENKISFKSRAAHKNTDKKINKNSDKNSDGNADDISRGLNATESAYPVWEKKDE